MRRAEELRDVLREASIGAVYATQTLRTWQTATPTATLAGVPITPYGDLSPAFFSGLKTRHAGRAVLIVGHSNTVGEIVDGLGGTSGPSIGEEFDNLFIVTIDGTTTQTERRKYHVLEPVGSVEFAGLFHPSDLSGIAKGPSADELVVVSDEGSKLQVLKKSGDGYLVRSSISLGADGGEKEFDLEGAAKHGDGETYYLIGSHALKRKNIRRRGGRRRLARQRQGEVLCDFRTKEGPRETDSAEPRSGDRGVG